MFAAGAGTVAIGLVAVAAPAAAAAADDAAVDPTAPAPQPYEIVQLGDSYSAGNGAGDYYGESGAYRSHRNYGSLYSDWLADQTTVPIQYTSYAHSGAETGDVLSTQLPQVSPDTDLVMFTIGGNDVYFQDIVKNCMVVGERSESDCRSSIDVASTGLPGVMDDTREIFSQLAATLDSDAQIALVGYPYLVQDVSYHLCEWEVMCWGDDELDVTGGIRALTDQANDLQSQLVDSWNGQSGVPQATFLPISGLFDGHEPSPGVTNPVNGYRWMQELFETETIQNGDVQTVSTPSVTELFFYHPGITGHQQIAQHIEPHLPVPTDPTSAAAPAIASVAVMAAPEQVPAPEAFMVGGWVRAVGSTITLDARGSAAGAGVIETYEWDFDGDGTFDAVTEEPRVDRVFDRVFDGDVAVRVTQTDGQSDTTAVPVRISEDGDSTPRELDNCPDTYNYSQSDRDGDGIGDECDTTPGWASSDAEGVLETTAATSVSMSSTSLEQGASVDVVAGGFVPGDSVEVWMHSEPMRIATGLVVADDGTVQTTVTVPRDATAGSHTIAVIGQSTFDKREFVVTAAGESAAVDGSTTPAALAASGGTPVSWWLGAAALVAVVAGSGVIVLRRRPS